MVQVKVSEGLLEGKLVNNEYGGTFCSFQGIPFAEPPLGDLRFKAPQPPKPWEGVRSAKECGPQCFQFDMIKKTEMKGSEDCLYLNVYTPDVKPDKPLPVMVWIHGGAFVCGSGADDMYGPEFLIRQGVIVVTINYRLEVLGFLCLNTKEVPGNAGMKDQVAALRWVKKNIANFGGDPSNVTIFGESAGGASVSYHLISPMSKGLFKRAIAQSGASLYHWAQANRPRDRALALAKQLGSYSEDNNELYEFFKKQPVESLVAAKAPITISESTKSELYFSVVDEKEFENNERFFYGDMVDVVSNGIHKGVEIMTGTTTDEGFVTINSKESVIMALEAARNFPDFFVPKLLSFNLPVNQQMELGKKIKKFYFNNEIRIPEDWESLVKFYSTSMFIFPTTQWAKECARRKKNKLYLYKFSCKSERNLMIHLLGLTELVGNKPVTCHADDLMYLFNAKMMKTTVDTKSIEFKLIERVTKLWTNFAKNGNPTPDNSLGTVWKPYTLENQDYLDIGNELKTGTVPDKEEIHFWENVLSEFEKKKIRKKSCHLF